MCIRDVRWASPAAKPRVEICGVFEALTGGFWHVLVLRGKVLAGLGAGTEPLCCGHSGSVEICKEHPHVSGVWELLALG